MGKQYPDKIPGSLPAKGQPVKSPSLSHRILEAAYGGLTRTYFLRTVAQLICEYYQTEGMVILIRPHDDPSRYELVEFSRDAYGYSLVPQANKNSSSDVLDSPELLKHWKYILSGEVDTALPFVSKKGSFWYGQTTGRLVDRWIEGFKKETYISYRLEQ